MPNDVAIVGSGPNGLAAAIRLARAGLSVRVYEAQPTYGGGMRSAAVTQPGFIHDLCSAVHPFAMISPFFESLPLAEHGVTWIQPDMMIAHPLDDGTAVAVTANLEETASSLGEDAETYRRLVGTLAHDLPTLAEDILAPLIHLPHHPFMLARFGVHAMLSASILASEFENPRSRALLAGCAAHSFRPLDEQFTGAFALLLTASAHAGGWPIARGGSQTIADAMVSILRGHGGDLVTNHRIDELPNARVVMFDTSPEAAARIANFPEKRLRERKRGPGIFKIDYALSAPVPWTAEACRRAGTVHVGGRFEEIAESESEMAHGKHPEKPFVLVSQPSIFDPTRAPAGQHTLWAYCHVPNGMTFDMSERIEAQIERFAPGFRDTILARSSMNTREVESHNANYLGGDISGGLTNPFSMLPYLTAQPGVYLCSASTAPGAGVHGMCGFHAAELALRKTFGRTPDSIRGAGCSP